MVDETSALFTAFGCLPPLLMHSAVALIVTLTCGLVAETRFLAVDGQRVAGLRLRTVADEVRTAGRDGRRAPRQETDNQQDDSGDT